MEARHAGQPGRRFLYAARSRPPYVGGRPRRLAGWHSEPRRDLGPAARRALRRDQGRPHLDDSRARGGIRAQGHPRQRHPAGLDRHGDDREGAQLGQVPRQGAAARADASLGQARGFRRDRGLSCQRREQLSHGRHFPHRRRLLPLLMKYRRFGRTGLQVSEVVVGAGYVGGIVILADDDTRRRVLRRALDAGINWIDTAPGYGQGRSEEALGWLLAEVADKPYLSTKVRLDLAKLADIPGEI